MDMFDDDNFNELSQEEKDKIYNFIMSKYNATIDIVKGPSFILPNGKFIAMKKAHNEIDELVEANFENFNCLMTQFGIMIEWYDCIRLNLGGGIFKNDVYITIPPKITKDQYYTILDVIEDIDRPIGIEVIDGDFRHCDGVKEVERFLKSNYVK